MGPMLTLHYLQESRAHRILWMLEELELDYAVELHERGPDGLAPPSIKALHPVGKAPLLQDGARVLAESGHIAAYLADTYGPQLIPADEQARLDYRYWLHFAEGSLAPPLIATYLFSIVEARTPKLLRPIVLFAPRMLQANYYDHTIADMLGFVDAHLDGREFFVGEALSTADIMMSFPLEAARARVADYPNIERWVAAIQARPAYQRALAKPGARYSLGQQRTPRAAPSPRATLVERASALVDMLTGRRTETAR